MCTQFVQRNARGSSGESATGPGNCKTRQPPIATNALAHPHTHTDPTTHRRTDLPTHDVLQQYCSTYSRIRVGTCRVYPCAVLGFPFFYDSPPPRGASDPSPEGHLFKAPARGVGHRRPFFRWCHRGLPCRAGVEPPRGRGRSSGARESQLFFGYVTTKKYFQRSIWMSLLLPSSVIQ